MNFEGRQGLLKAGSAHWSQAREWGQTVGGLQKGVGSGKGGWGVGVRECLRAAEFVQAFRGQGRKGSGREKDRVH